VADLEIGEEFPPGGVALHRSDQITLRGAAVAASPVFGVPDGSISSR
jgi:hypothetical protein